MPEKALNVQVKVNDSPKFAVLSLDVISGISEERWRLFSQIFLVSLYQLDYLREGGLSFWKKDFKLGIGGDSQDTSRHFEGSFGSIRAILPM